MLLTAIICVRSFGDRLGLWPGRNVRAPFDSSAFGGLAQGKPLSTVDVEHPVGNTHSTGIYTVKPAKD